MTPDKFNDFKVGIPEIDKEHWEIFTSMNEIFDAIDRKDYDRAAGLLASFETQTQAHFGNEIKVMEEMGFPFIQTHKNEHGELLATFRDLAANIKKGKVDIVTGAMERIVTMHVIHYDMLYASYAKNLRMLTSK